MTDSNVVQDAFMEAIKEAVNTEVVSNDSIQKSIIANLNLKQRLITNWSTSMILSLGNLQQYKI